MKESTKANGTEKRKDSEKLRSEGESKNSWRGENRDQKEQRHEQRAIGKMNRSRREIEI